MKVNEERISNKESIIKAKELKNFLGTNIFGENYNNKIYVIYSFNHSMPIYIWINLEILKHLDKTLYNKIIHKKEFRYKNGIWIKNKDTYTYKSKYGYSIVSNTTERHKKNYKFYNVILKKTEYMKKLINDYFEQENLDKEKFFRYKDSYPKNHINYDEK